MLPARHRLRTATDFSATLRGAGAARSGGRLLVGAAGLVVIGIGGYLVAKGVTRRFLAEIDTAQASASQRRLIERLGQAGFTAKGAAFAVVGVVATKCFLLSRMPPMLSCST